jgi:hypothetical protein
LLNRAHRRRLDAAGPYPPDLLGPDEAARLEHLKVLDNRRKRHRERLGELADRCRSTAQPLHDHPSTGVRERLEREIERRTLLKHLLKYRNR